MNRPVFLSLTDEDGVLIDQLQLDAKTLADADQLIERLCRSYERAQQRHAGELAAEEA